MSVNRKISNDGLIYLFGLGLTAADGVSFTVDSGQCRNSTNENDIVLSNPVTVNTAATGAAGLDQGTIANSTFYAVYIIGDSKVVKPTTAILSLDTDAPALPFGYDMFRRVGWIKTDDAGAIFDFVQIGKGVERQYYLNIPIPQNIILSGGDLTPTEIDVSVGMPPIQSNIIVNIDYSPGGATNLLKIDPFGLSSFAAIFSIEYGGLGVISNYSLPVGLDNGVPKIVYEVDTGDSVTFFAVGFVDQL